MLVAIRTESQFPGLRGFPEIGQKFSFEFSRKNLDRNEKVFIRIGPLPSGAKSAAGNDAVQMRMIRQVLPPRMQDSGKPNLCTEILWIPGQFQ